MRYLVLLAAAYIAFTAPTVTAKGSAGTATSATATGDVQCPCFCSERSSDFSTYWLNNYGTTPDEFKCATPCYEASEAESMLGFCKGVVNYRFCGRYLEINQDVSNASAIIAEYDEEAQSCVGETWPEETLEDDCKASVRRGACYLAFPKCDDNDKPLKTCSSFCMNERVSCRTLNSNLGSTEMISGGCSDTFIWADATGPDNPLCTGAASSPYSAVGTLAVLVVVALVVLVL